MSGDSAAAFEGNSDVQSDGNRGAASLTVTAAVREGDTVPQFQGDRGATSPPEALRASQLGPLSGNYLGALDAYEQGASMPSPMDVLPNDSLQSHESTTIITTTI